MILIRTLILILAMILTMILFIYVFMCVWSKTFVLFLGDFLQRVRSKDARVPTCTTVSVIRKQVNRM